MNKQELVQCFSDIAKEKNVDRTEIGTILEELFLTLIEKQYGDASNCSVIVNIDRGEIEIYQEKTIVKEVEDPGLELELEKARAVEPDLDVGDTFIDVVDPSLFGRRLISTAKQFLAQRIRDVEKKYMFEDYFGRVGEIVIGDVRQVHRDNLYVHIDQSELRLPREEQIETERYRRGDTIRAIIKSVEMTSKGPDIVISRSDNQFLAKLFEMEVPEIEDGIIEILSIARAPGQRSKIIVRSTDKRIDAVGACVGMRGSRIQAIVRELHGERIDVINHTTRSEVLISRALSPAKPKNLYIDDEKKYCVSVFDDEDMDSAVGKNYLNVRLAAEVSGYTIDAVKASEYGEEKKEEVVYLDQVDTLTPRMISLLSDGEIDTATDFKEASRADLLQIKGMGEKTLDTIGLRIDAYLENLRSTQEVEAVEGDGEAGEEVQPPSSETMKPVAEEEV